MDWLDQNLTVVQIYIGMCISIMYVYVCADIYMCVCVCVCIINVCVRIWILRRTLQNNISVSQGTQANWKRLSHLSKVTQIISNRASLKPHLLNSKTYAMWLKILSHLGNISNKYESRQNTTLVYLFCRLNNYQPVAHLVSSTLSPTKTTLALFWSMTQVL